jgi:hypothetical protein
MGFWQGLNEGLTYVMEDKARKKELEAARQERLDERQANMDFQMRQYEIQKADAAAAAEAARVDRLQEIALPLYVDRAKQEAEVKRVTAGAQSLLSIFENSEDPNIINDPKVIALRNNPSIADKLWKDITAVREKAVSQGITLPVDPQTLLDNMVVTGSGEPVPLLTSGGFPKINNYDDLVEAAATFSAPLTTAEAELDPEYGFIPDPTNLVEGRKLFEKNLFTVAAQERDRILKEAGEDVDGAGQIAFGKIEKLLKDAGTDPAARAELERRFGQQAFDATITLNSPYTNALSDTPEFGAYMTQFKADTVRLQEIVADPNSTPAQKTAAQEELDKRIGRL